MGNFPFYTGVKIPWNTGSGSGARTKLGQGGNNRKKEQEMKAVKPDMTGIKDDIHDDYRPNIHYTYKSVKVMMITDLSMIS